MSESSCRPSCRRRASSAARMPGRSSMSASSSSVSGVRTCRRPCSSAHIFPTHPAGIGVPAITRHAGPPAARDDVTSAVAGLVIDHHDLESPALRTKRGNRPSDDGRFVAGGDERRDARTIRGTTVRISGIRVEPFAGAPGEPRRDEDASPQDCGSRRQRGDDQERRTAKRAVRPAVRRAARGLVEPAARGWGSARLTEWRRAVAGEDRERHAGLLSARSGSAAPAPSGRSCAGHGARRPSL